MPGIADNNVQPINTAPIAAIGSDQPVRPEIKDFMDAFRSGFITVDDITRRTKQGVIDTSNMQTTLSANDLTRRKQAAELELLPGQQAEAATQQQIQATTAPVRVGMAKEQADKFARYQADPQKFLAEESDRQVEATYIQAAGPLPETLLVKNPEKPIPYDEWLMLRNKVNADAGEFFSNDSADGAKTLKSEYDGYVEAMANVPVKRGTPEYAKALRKEVNDLSVGSAIQGAKLKALQGILEKRAAGGTPHVSTVKRPTAGGLEQEVSVVTDPTTGDIISETVLSTGAPKLTEAQGRAQLFATRMAENNRTLNSLEAAGFDPSAASATAQRFIPNRLRGADFQQYTAAKDNWISAVLRQESGAAISASEYQQANKEYFPRDGDSPAVVAQKQRLRALAEERMKAIGGPSTASAPAPSNGASTPSAGTKRVIQNGVTFEWNGSQYVPVQ